MHTSWLKLKLKGIIQKPLKATYSYTYALHISRSHNCHSSYNILTFQAGQPQVNVPLFNSRGRCLPRLDCTSSMPSIQGWLRLSLLYWFVWKKPSLLLPSLINGHICNTITDVMTTIDKLRFIFSLTKEGKLLLCQRKMLPVVI